MKYVYVTCDVFTRSPFGGNPLAVIPDAVGLTTQQMQQIAREFNYSETTFVLPAQGEGTHRVRIFTPTTEVPFAGHPNVGTAFSLCAHRLVPEDTAELRFEEAAGLVPVTVRHDSAGAGDGGGIFRRIPGDGGGIFCELKAPEQLNPGAMVRAGRAAQAVGLEEDDIVTRHHEPQVASVGLPFLMVEVRDRETLGRAVPNIDGMRELLADGITPDVYLYTRDAGDYDIQARMFAPLDGVLEDPATGSANCALAGLLTALDAGQSAVRLTERSYRISQGSEMGRPSELYARTLQDPSCGDRTEVYIGGYSVAMRSGAFEA